MNVSTIEAPYEPEPGDLIWTDFDPRVGREQSGRRPALVISPKSFWQASGMAVVCPITRRVRNYGSSVLLPPTSPIGGEILTSHVRSIDTSARRIRFTGAAAPAAVLAEVRENLAILCGL